MGTAPVKKGRAVAATHMAVETTYYDDISALVRVSGELDFGSSAALWAVLRCHRLAGRRYQRLDLSGVTFLDASALAGILTAHEASLALRGTLVITGVRSIAAKVLRLTGLDDVLFVSGPRADGDTTVRYDLRDDLELTG